MKILIPTPLRQYADKKDTIEVRGATVAEALKNLTSQYADLHRHLFTDDGKLRTFVNVYLNDEDIRYLQKEATPVKDTDTLAIVPSIAGGLRNSRIVKLRNCGIEFGPSITRLLNSPITQ